VGRRSVVVLHGATFANRSAIVLPQYAGLGRPGTLGMRCCPGEYLVAMSDLWQLASEASGRFGAQALDYDRYRPRYPEGVFDDILRVTDTSEGAEVIEIGAGTGIATEPFARRGLSITAIEPSPEMATLAQAKLSGRGSVFVGRFEDYTTPGPVQLVASFNAWHWVDPAVVVDRVAELLTPGGSLALVWTEVVSWGEEPFEERLAQISGYQWVKRMDHVDGSMRPIRSDPRFEDHLVLHHVFERTLDASTLVAVTKTYGGQRTNEQYEALARVVNDEFGGSITKVEDAAVYIWRRR
jgi:SAM-dependent methyltransferase